MGVYSGIPDVSASKPEMDIVSWLIETTKDHSISARAEDIIEPRVKGDSLSASVFSHYNEMCVTCHGAPGIDPDDFT